MRALVIDDDPVTQLIVAKHVEAHGLTVKSADDGLAGLNAVRDHAPHLCVVDWMMPALDGLSLVHAIRASENGEKTYIMMLTSKSDESSFTAAFKIGVDDFITKPVKKHEIHARLTAAVRLINLRQQLEDRIEEAAVLNEQLTRTNRQLDRLASIDSMTGLLNRRVAMGRMIKWWQKTLVDHEVMSCAIIDIDHFKSVNDRFGHAFGDRILMNVAHRLEQAFGEKAVVARFGGEEFVVSWLGLSASAAMEEIESIRKQIIEAKFECNGTGIRVSFSCGVCDSRLGVESLDDLLRAADVALYAAKNRGRNQSVVALDGAAAMPIPDDRNVRVEERVHS